MSLTSDIGFGQHSNQDIVQADESVSISAKNALNIKFNQNYHSQEERSEEFPSLSDKEAAEILDDKDNQDPFSTTETPFKQAEFLIQSPFNDPYMDRLENLNEEQPSEKLNSSSIHDLPSSVRENTNSEIAVDEDIKESKLGNYLFCRSFDE
jgi:hypothetical protein